MTTTAITPLLNTTGETTNRRFSQIAGIRSTASILQRVNSRRMMSEQSLRVRESAAQIINERRSDWAYSTPVVIVDLIWNAALVAVAIVAIFMSNSETAKVPLRSWIVGYCIQCVLHMVCVCVEYRRRREVRRGSAASFAASSLGVGPNLESSSNLMVHSDSSPVSYANSSQDLGSSVSAEADFVEYFPEPRPDDDNTSVAKHLESASTMFSFIWWIIGFYWVQSGGEMLVENAPKLYWVTTVFLAFDVFFVMICVIVACIIGIAVCCFLPCIIAVLYTVSDQDGASKEDIERLTRYRFKRHGEAERIGGEIQESSAGTIIECGTDTPTEISLSAEDADCSICLSDYEDECELRELPCHHRFHSECVDKWLYMNPTCPLCKYNILKDGNQSTDQV